MGIISIVILALTALGLAFGALFGVVRGRNRSILRLILIVICVVGAIFLREPLTKVILGLNPNGQPIEQTFISMLNQGETVFPESVITLIINIVQIFLGIIAYFIAFFGLRMVTWAIVFPICKIFVKEGEKMHRGFGALVGLAQGVIIAFAVISPMNGLIVQVDKISKIELQEKPLFEMPASVGLEQYVNGPICKTYSAIGGWYFNILTSTDKLSINDVTDMVSVVGGLAGSMTDLTKGIDVLAKEDATAQEKMDALKGVGNSLIEVGEGIDSLSDQAKAQIDAVLADLNQLINGGEASDEMDEFFDGLTLSDVNIAGLGHALVGVTSVMEKQESEQELNQEDINHIVTGFATNMKFVEVLTDGEENVTMLTDLSEQEKEMFENSISEQNLSAEQEQSLRSLLGLA